jgi:hypothetical protein
VRAASNAPKGDAWVFTKNFDHPLQAFSPLQNKISPSVDVNYELITEKHISTARLFGILKFHDIPENVIHSRIAPILK